MEEPEPMETAEKETGAAGYPGAGAGSPEVDGAPAGQDKDLVASRVSNNETQGCIIFEGMYYCTG